MTPLTRTGLAALLAAAAATPALAQTYGTPGYNGQPYGSSTYDRQAYPPSTYDRSATSGYQPPSSYDRGAYPPSTYDTGRAPPAYAYDQSVAPPADDPEALARQLNLTSSQRAAFDSYRAAFRPDETRARQEEAEMNRMASLTTPQRLDLARASLSRDRADFDRTDAATRSFYAQLSPSQRRTFDRLTAPQMDDGAGGPSPTQPAAPPPPR